MRQDERPDERENEGLVCPARVGGCLQEQNLLLPDIIVLPVSACSPIPYNTGVLTTKNQKVHTKQNG